MSEPRRTFTRRLWAACVRAPRRMAIGLIRGYQVIVSPLLGPRCRFEPSCSRYACGCFERHGFWRGGLLTARRLGRCHPFHPGGYDPVPELEASTSAAAKIAGHDPGVSAVHVPALAVEGPAIHPTSSSGDAP